MRQHADIEWHVPELLEAFGVCPADPPTEILFAAWALAYAQDGWNVYSGRYVPEHVMTPQTKELALVEGNATVADVARAWGLALEIPERNNVAPRHSPPSPSPLSGTSHRDLIDLGEWPDHDNGKPFYVRYSDDGLTYQIHPAMYLM